MVFEKVALVTTDQQGCIAARDALRESFSKRKLSNRIVLDELTPPGARDFRTILGKAKAKGATLVVSTLLQGSVSSIAKQMKQQHLAAELAGFELFEDENEVKASEGALLGAWYVNVDNPSEASLENYKNTYSGLPGWGAPNAYDTLMLVSDAIARHGAQNARIADFLRAVKSYTGAAGTYSASGDNRFDLPVAVKVVEDGGFRKLR